MSLSDLIGQVLEVVVLDRSPVPVRLVDQLFAVLTHLLVIVPGLEPVPEHGHVELLEAGQIAVPAHHVDDRADLVHVLPQLVEPLEEQPFEVVEQLGALALEQLDVLARELEGGGLEVPVPGRRGEDEPEVDVDDVPLVVDQEVAVVPVLDLEDVGQDAVGGEGLGEPLLRVVYLLLVGVEVEVEQRGEVLGVLLLELVDGDAVGD